jgi:hypothetical protein
MRVPGTAQRYPCQANKKQRSYEANCMFHDCPHLRLRN